MNIYIPTYKRTDKQITLGNLPKSLYDQTYLVCVEEEAEELSKYGAKILVTPPEVKGIGPTRQYVIDNAKDKHILFLDDDLKFYRRNEEAKLKKINPDEFHHLHTWINYCLEMGYPMVGVSAQAGNNRFKGNFAYLQRIFTVYGLNTEFLKEKNIRFDEMELMEDFNVALKIIRHGFKTILNTEFAHTQSNSNASGGCSEYRNYELQKKSAYMLMEKHYPYVKVVKKNAKSWTGLQERYDVRIQWKKAYIEGTY